MESRVIQESIDNENVELQNCHLKPFSVQSESVIETVEAAGTDLSLTNIGPESIAYEIEKLIDVRKDETGQLLYQARWVAHTWIPEEYLLSFPLLLKQYWEDRQKHNLQKFGEESESQDSCLIEDSREKAEITSLHGEQESDSLLSSIVAQAYPCEKTIEDSVISCQKCDQDFLKVNHNAHIEFCKGKDEHIEIQRPENVGYLSLTENSPCVTCITRQQDGIKSNLTVESQLFVNCHLKVIADNTQIFECNECHRDFLNKQPLSDFSMKPILYSNLIHGSKSPIQKDLEKNTAEILGKPFKCCVCCRAFSTKNEMKEHEMKHVPTSSRYTCATCSAKFVTRVQLEGHYDSDSNECSPRKCEICDRKFIHSNHLKRHMTIHAGLKPFICPICDHEFNQRSDLQRHQKRHVLPDGSYACNKCAKCFETIDKLKDHILSEHKPDENSKTSTFKCERCGKVFGRKSHYKRHLTIHEGLKPHVCELCCKSFNQKTDLNRHTMTHLRKHMKIYGENSMTANTCEVCNKTFTTQAKFVEHYLGHQKIMIY